MFALFYVKHDKLYPVMMTKDEFEMLQISVTAFLQKPIRILDKPQGDVVNMKNESEVNK